MLVKDEMSGQVFEAAEVVWILGTNGGFTQRDRSIPHTTARLHQVQPHYPGAKPWGLVAGGAAWVPVAIVPPDTASRQTLAGGDTWERDADGCWNFVGRHT